MEIKKLKALPYGQAFVEIDKDNNCIYLWSYRTLVAKIENDWLTINGLYSMTTRRHIGAFVKEYSGGLVDYQMVKIIYEKRERLNIETGELEDIEK